MQVLQSTVEKYKGDFMSKYMEIKIENNRISEINYLKGFSILTIVIMHLIQGYITGLPTILHKLTAFGGSGVHVFFLCSGIGLYLSYIKNKLTFKEFIIKRISKIYIPYIIIVIISFLVPWLYTENDRLIALFSHVFLFKMFFEQYEQSFGVQFWFVSTIIQLYVLFIPMCKIKQKIKNNKMFLSIFLIISVIWWLFVYIVNLGKIRIWNSFCLQYIWEFAFGMVIADYFYHHKKIKIRYIYLFILTFVGIGLQFIMVYFSDTLKVFNDIPSLIGYGGLALILCNIPFFNKIITKVSYFSYELFLIHILIFEIVFHIANFDQMIFKVITGIVAVIISLICAWGYHQFVAKVIYKKQT